MRLLIDAIRKRPAMYLGGTGFFGFVQFVVSAFDLALQNGATWVEIEFESDRTDRIHLRSDASVPTEMDDRGRLTPFEAFGNVKPTHSPDAAILTALSEKFDLVLRDGSTETRLSYEFGDRLALTRSANTSEPEMRMTFSADFGIFSTTQVSPAVVHSYCRRTACLYPGTLFRVKLGSDVAEYRSENGLIDFFTAISTPYQLLHQPIRLRESKEELSVEAIFVFQSWTDSRIWSFANKGRVPDGGTHETGLLDAIARMHNNLADGSCTGILAVLAIESPHLTFEGCLKSRIGNPELREQVAELVTAGISGWARENVEEVEHIKQIERFQFASIW